MSRHPCTVRRFALLLGALFALGPLSATHARAARVSDGEYDFLEQLNPEQQQQIRGWGQPGWQGINPTAEQMGTILGKVRDVARQIEQLELVGSTLPAAMKRTPSVALKVIDDFVAQAGPRLAVTGFPEFGMMTKMRFRDGERRLEILMFPRGGSLGSSGLFVKVYRYVDGKEIASRNVELTASQGRYGSTQVIDEAMVGARTRKTVYFYQPMSERPGGWVGQERVAGARGPRFVLITPDGVERSVSRAEHARLWSHERMLAYRLPLRPTDPGFNAGLRTVVDLPKHILKQAGVQLVFDKRGRSYVRRAAGFDKALLKEMGVQWVGRAKDGSQRAYLRKQGQPGQRYAHYYR